MIETNHLSLSEIGTIEIDEDGIHCDGFYAEGASCREVAILALEWAIEHGLDDGNFEDEILALRQRPGGTMRVSVN